MARVHIGNVFPSDDYLLARCAPAGYGLGEDIIKKYIDKADLDNTFVNGLYWVTCIGCIANGQTFNYAILRVTGNGTTHCIHELFPLGLDMVLRRRCYNGVWSEGWGMQTWDSNTDIGGI